MKNWFINLAISIFVRKIIREGISNEKVFAIGIHIGEIITKKGTAAIGGINFNLLENEIQKKSKILLNGITTGLNSDD